MLQRPVQCRSFSQSFPIMCFTSRLVQQQNRPAVILIVDDDQLIRTLLRRSLETSGYQVLEASNGQQCLDLYEQFQPDLVLLDCMMPIMNGFACCHALKSRFAEDCSPVVMMTSTVDTSAVEQAFAVGAVDYVTKPIHWSLLRHRIERLLQARQATLELQYLNTVLEHRVQDRTAALEQALKFEAILKRITERVRNSLDEEQILQTVVQELALTLEAGCCNAALYSSEQDISTVRYEYVHSISGYQGKSIQMSQSAEVYVQLQQGYAFQFCSITPNPQRGRVAMYACPILHEGQAIGDLWLITPPERSFAASEVRLVQQVANQCAIAIRQAHLYRAAQQQVEDLERLNQLKDDFLSTVSHELRSPITNMRLVIHMLDYALQQRQSQETDPSSAASNSRESFYLHILRSECDREITLINDLLDLQRLEMGRRPLGAHVVHLSTWLSTLLESFYGRIRDRQQTLIVDLADDLPNLLLDELSLRRILTELLTNACKYTPEAGTIAVKAETYREMLYLKVQNSGVEIPPRELSRIFDKFYRVPNGDPWQQGGTGLGLALVKQLIEHLGGVIQVQSAAQQTCFTLQIPIGNLHLVVEPKSKSP